MKKSIITILLFLQTTLILAQIIKADFKMRSPENTVLEFLKWYEKNQEQLGSTGPALKGGFPDTTTFYHVDFKSVNTYLNQFKKSGLVSDFYLEDFKLYFISISNSLSRYPLKQGPVVGLNLDVVLKTFEDRDILDHLDEGTFEVTKVEDGKVIVKYTIGKGIMINFLLSKIHNQWLIDKLLGYDDLPKY